MSLGACLTRGAFYDILPPGFFLASLFFIGLEEILKLPFFVVPPSCALSVLKRREVASTEKLPFLLPSQCRRNRKLLLSEHGKVLLPRTSCLARAFLCWN